MKVIKEIQVKKDISLYTCKTRQHHKGGQCWGCTGTWGHVTLATDDRTFVETFGRAADTTWEN
jgi:hypothetical protein